MTHRDRAWRRRVSRIAEHRDDSSTEWLYHQQLDGKTHQPVKQHRPGKLTGVQALRQDWQLRAEASDDWVVESVVVEPPSA